MSQKPTERPQTAGAGDDARRALRRFFLLGPAEDGGAEGPRVVPTALAAFLGSGRVRTDYPLYLGSPTLSAPAATGTGGAHGALCLGFDELISRARRSLEGDGAAVGQVLRDNLKRLEAHLLEALEAGPEDADARETLRAAGAAMAEELWGESGLSEADHATLTADVERLAGALPPVGDGPHAERARLLAPRTGVSLDLLRHALVAGRRTTRETFLREARELVDKGRALIEADRRKRGDGAKGRDGEAERGAMGALGKRFVDPSALAGVLGERRGSAALDPKRRERLEASIEALAEAAERIAAPRVRLIHDGSLPWVERQIAEGVRAEGWIVVESSDPCAVAAEVFDREAEALAAALRGRERVRLETSGEYEAARHEPWLERLAGFDWRAFDAGEAALIEPMVALESAGELAERGMLSLSKLLRSGRPVQVLVALDPAMSPGVEDVAGGFRFEPGYLGMSHREAFVQQSSEARPLHLMEGFLRGASSSRTSLHVVAPWPQPCGISGRERAGERRGDLPGLDPALIAGAAIDGRAHPLFRYDPETGPSWAHRLDFSGNPEPAADWPVEDAAGEGSRPFTFVDFALLDPALRSYVTPIVTGASAEDDLVPIGDWLDLPVDEAIHKIPTVSAVPVDVKGEPAAEPITLAVARPLAAACRDRLGFWRTLQELAGVKSEYVRRAAEATREEVEQAARAERERLEVAHAAELERVRERSAREAVDRLTAALLEVDLGLFAEMPREIPSLAGKTTDEVAAALMEAVGGDLSDLDQTVAAGNGAPSSEAVDAAARQLLELVDPAEIDRELDPSLEHTTE